MRILVGPLPVPPQIGDAAISVGAIALLREAHPDAEIRGWVTGGGMDDPRVVASYAQTYDVDGLLSFPASFAGVDCRLGMVGELHRAGAKYALPACSRVIGRAALSSLWGLPAESAREIADADLVVMRGGGYLSSPNLLCDLWGLRLNSVNDVSLARALGTPYAIWGHTIWDLDGPLSRRIMLPLIRDSVVTVCREQQSYNYIAAAGAPRHKLAVLPDTAFAVQPAHPSRAAEILREEGLDPVGTRLLGVSARPLWRTVRGFDSMLPRYLGAMAEAVNTVARQHDVLPVLVSHCHSTDLHTVPAFQDDRAFARQLAERLECDHHILQGDYSPSEVAAIYGTFEVMFASRLHAGVLAATAGTPSVVVDYGGAKAQGIAAMLGIGDYVVDLAEFVAGHATTVFTRLYEVRETVSRLVRHSMESIRTALGRYHEVTSVAGHRTPHRGPEVAATCRLRG